MSDLKTRFWVDALRWRAESGGAAIYVARRGDPDAGAVLVKVSLLDGTARLFVPVTDFSGERVWSQPLGDSLEDRYPSFDFEQIKQGQAQLGWAGELEQAGKLLVVESARRWPLRCRCDPVGWSVCRTRQSASACAADHDLVAEYALQRFESNWSANDGGSRA